MKKALIVASVFGFIGAFEKSNLKLLLNQQYNVYCAANGSKELGDLGDTGQLDDFEVNKCQIDFKRNPLSKSNITAYKQLRNFINENNFDLIHCHTPIGGILTRLAARKARKKGTKVIYTAHGFHFFKGAPLVNWLLYYSVEKVCSYFTDALITINHEDYELAKRKMRAKKIYYVPGVGVDTNKFANVTVDRDKKREELGISKDTIVLLSIGELTKRKNHETALKALAKVDRQNIVYLICGRGELEGYLKNLAKSLEIEDKVRFLGFRNDISEICVASDIFIFPSYQEGLPVALMEAMAAGLPCIASKIRGNIDLIENEKGGYLFRPNDVVEFTEAIKKLANDEGMRKEMGKHNLETIKQFDIKNVKKNMIDIYINVITG